MPAQLRDTVSAGEAAHIRMGQDDTAHLGRRQDADGSHLSSADEDDRPLPS